MRGVRGRGGFWADHLVIREISRRQQSVKEDGSTLVRGRLTADKGESQYNNTTEPLGDQVNFIMTTKILRKSPRPR